MNVQTMGQPKDQIINGVFHRAFETRDWNPIFKAIEDGNEHITIHNIQVPATGIRLQAFTQAWRNGDLVCSNENCHHQAGFFAIEKQHIGTRPPYNEYHLNLYGWDEDGYEVLFTHDHKIARALGGTDEIENIEGGMDSDDPWEISTVEKSHFLNKPRLFR